MEPPPQLAEHNMTDFPDLRGGGWWDDLPGDARRRAWDERDHDLIDANLFQERDEQQPPAPLPQRMEEVTVTYANVTSWKKHGRHLTDQAADLIVAVETRMAADLWGGELARLQQQGYMAVIGQAPTQPNRVTYSGVAILARLPATIGAIDLAPHLQEKWAGRLAAGRYYPPNSNAFMLVIAAYAPFVGTEGREADERNKEFITDLFAFMAEHDGCPILLAADLNRAAGDPFLEQHLADGRWADILRDTTGTRDPTTVDPQYREGGRPIDHVYGNAAMVRQVSRAYVATQPIVQHLPIHMHVRWLGDYRMLTLQDRVRLPPEAHLPLAVEAEENWSWDQRREQFDHALREADANAATIEWMRRWEELLIARALAHGARVTSAMRGRWRLDPPRLQHRGRHKARQEVEDTTLADLKRIRNLLIEAGVRQRREAHLSPQQRRQLQGLLQRHRVILEQRQPDRPPPIHPVPPPAGPVAEDQDLDATGMARHPGAQEQQQQQQPQPLPPLAPHPVLPLHRDEPAGEVHHPALDAAMHEDAVDDDDDDDDDDAWEPQHALLHRVRSTIHSQEACLRRDRIRKWREQLKATTRLGTAKCHAYVKGRVINPLQRLRAPNGDIVTLPEQLHDVLRQAWSPIDNPADVKDAATCREIMQRSYHHYRHDPWPLQDITTKDVQAAVGSARLSSSPGKGSWTFGDIKSLPAIAKTELARLLTLWDRVGPPSCLGEVYITMLPKQPGNPDPLALRPIAVEPLLIRLWTTIRVRAWARHIMASIPEEQHGAVPTRSAVQLVTELATDLEQSKLLGKPLCGISYDFSKFFDSLPQHLVAPTLVAAGVPEGWAERYMAFIINQQYRYRFTDRTAGPLFTKCCGVPQGDAFSVVTSLLMLVALTQAVCEAGGPALEARMYLDDLVVRSCDMESLRRADEAVHHFAAERGIQISPKTTAFAMDDTGRHALRRMNHPITTEFKWLGTHHTTTGGNQTEAAEQALIKKLDTARLRLQRVSWIKLPWDLRQQLVMGNALAGLVWCPVGQPHDLHRLRAMDLATFHSMFAANPKALQKAAKEIFWTTLVKGHRLATEGLKSHQSDSCPQTTTTTLPRPLAFYMATLPGYGAIHPRGSFADIAESLAGTRH